MDKKCIAKCVSPCPIENIAEKDRCRVYEIGRASIIKPFLQYLNCPVHKNNNVEWEDVEREVTK